MTFNFLDSSWILDSWLQQHSVVAWLLQHPLISLGLLFISLVLLFRLFAALTQILDRLWLWLLRSPILLIKSLLGIGKKESEPTLLVNKTSNIESDMAQQLVTQLQLIQKQQTQIINEITALKKQLKMDD